jgi:hypothetical protein
MPVKSAGPDGITICHGCRYVEVPHRPKERRMDSNEVIPGEWLGVLGSAVIMAVVVALGMPSQDEVRALGVAEKAPAPRHAVGESRDLRQAFGPSDSVTPGRR